MMFDSFIKQKKQVRILQREQYDYITGYIIDFDQENRSIKFRGDKTYIIPLTSIVHLYESK